MKLLFRSRNVAGPNVLQALLVAGMFGMFFLGALYLQRVLGYSPLEVGLAFLPTTAAAHAAAAHSRIGRVLSCGGARGVAHVGVLEWMEEHRIPVDYSGGAGIGGLVAGMYAAGMTPQRVRALIDETGLCVSEEATLGLAAKYRLAHGAGQGGGHAANSYPRRAGLP